MNAPINRTMTATEWTLLGALAVLWGGSYFANAVAVAAVPPLTIVAFRVALGGALLVLTVRSMGQHLPRDAASWRGFLVMGILNNVVPFTLIVWAQSHVASGLAAILNASTPVFAVLLAHWLTADEKITAARLAGVVVGFIGVVLMIGPDALAGAAGDVVAELALVLASVFYALSAIYGRRFSRAGLTPMVSAAGQITAAAALMVPLALVFDRPWTLAMPPAGVWAALVGLAAISTTLAYIIYYRILATAGAGNLMLVTLLVPVGAIVLGALFLGERLSTADYAGLVTIAVGLALIDGRALRVFRRAAQA